MSAMFQKWLAKQKYAFFLHKQKININKDSKRKEKDKK